MRVRTFRLLSIATLVASSLVVACNLDGGGDDYFGFAGGGSSSSVDGGTSAKAPATLDTCDRAKAGDNCETAACEKKDHPNFACNPLLRCVDGYWEREDAAKTSCASDCPAAYVEDLPDGCAATNAGTRLCEYPQGTCGCAPVRPNGGDAGDNDTDDAGTGEADADAGPTRYVWTCVSPDAGCPRTRPRAGDDCVRPMSCDYGDCVFEDGVTMICFGKSWTARKRCDL